MSEKEIIFEYGAEGGGTMVFRIINDEGKKEYYHTGNYMQFDIDDWKTISGRIEDLEIYINDFFKEERWFMYYPLYIIPELHSRFKKALKAIPKKLLKQFSHSKHDIENWQEVMKKKNAIITSRRGLFD